MPEIRKTKTAVVHQSKHFVTRKGLPLFCSDKDNCFKYVSMLDHWQKKKKKGETKLVCVQRGEGNCCLRTTIRTTASLQSIKVHLL